MSVFAVHKLFVVRRKLVVKIWVYGKVAEVINGFSQHVTAILYVSRNF
ncbi:hypothetical protein SDC9_200048 [bioreactor metagenome]|uniref:Uncharacterized protein n=1 Tax=bioreactor metagenome TaxID=1076179 RepID=A0A645IMA7_9ZZZZ